jgi:hypothetical protein
MPRKKRKVEQDDIPPHGRDAALGCVVVPVAAALLILIVYFMLLA